MADHKQFRLLAVSKNLVRILKYCGYVTKGDNVLHVSVTTVCLWTWKSHWVPLRLITTVFKQNRSSFSRLRWHPGQQIVTARPCKGGNNKLQWNTPRYKTTDPCLLASSGSSGSSLYAAKERTIMSRWWPLGHPSCSGRWLMFIMVLVIMGCKRCLDL